MKTFSYLFAVSILLFSTMSFASPKQEEAQEAMRKGGSFFNEGSYNDAIKEFRKAAKLIPEASGPYREIAKCFTQLNQHNKAFHYFSEYLSLRPDAPTRDALEDYFVEQRKTLSKRQKVLLSVNSEPKGAVVYTIGKKGKIQGIGLTPLRNHPVADSTVSVRVVLPEYRVEEQKLKLQESKTNSLFVRLKKSSSPMMVNNQPSVDPFLEDEPSKSGLLTVSVISGIASVSVGAVFFIDRAGFQNLLPGDPTAENRQKRVLIEAIAADVLLGTALLTGGLGLYLRGKSSSKKEKKELGLRIFVHPSGAGISGSF